MLKKIDALKAVLPSGQSSDIVPTCSGGCGDMLLRGANFVYTNFPGAKMSLII